MKSKIYQELTQELPHYWTDDWLTNLSQTSAMIYHRLPGLNWVGFYLKQGPLLRLGPFQGKPACMDIEIGKGVCGTSAWLRQTIVVPDVHQFSGHIVCDSASNSEIVVPLIDKGQVFGVLDLDSPYFNHFDFQDAQSLETIVSSMILKTSIKK